MDKSAYIQEQDRQLSYTYFCKEIHEDLTS